MCKRDDEAGFSLVELLAVLAILSLMVGAVVLNLPERARPLDVQTQAMTDQLQARLDRAALSGEMRGLGLDGESLVLFEDRGGIIVPELTLDWPSGARLRVLRGGKLQDLPEDPRPTDWIEPYGPVPDLRIELQGADAGYALTFDARGRLIREGLE